MYKLVSAALLKVFGSFAASAQTVTTPAQSLSPVPAQHLHPSLTAGTYG